MITPETHDHALTCDITTGRGCDCGLTGMAAVAFWTNGVAVYKEPRERKCVTLTNTPIADRVKQTGKSIAEVGEEMYQEMQVAAKCKTPTEAREELVIDATRAVEQARKQAEDIKPYMAAVDFLKRRKRAAWGDVVDIRKIDTADLLKMLTAEAQAEIKRRGERDALKN